MTINTPRQTDDTNLKEFKGQFDWLSPEELANAHDWWDIYIQSFPPHERDTKQQISLALQKNIAQVGCYRINHAIAAIVVLYRMHSPAFAFLHYFAVAKAWRNQSLGSKLFPLIMEEADKFVLKNNQQTLGLFWEVEDPEAAENDMDRHMQNKRISFYKKLGGKLFKTKFIQPPINNHDIVHLRLMSNTIEKSVVEKEIAKAIYFQKYQTINGAETKALTGLLNQCHTDSSTKHKV
jgi:GNAT superfamily N-acetyltransferase